MEPIGARISGMEHKVDEIKRAVENVANHGGGNQNVTQVRFEGASWPLVACLLLAVVASVTAAGTVLFAMDARNEMRTNNTNRERDIGELRQTDHAVRAYINTGRLSPSLKEK